MRFFLAMLLFSLSLSGFSPAANAEVNIDESLKQNFTYLDAAPALKPNAMTFLMLQSPKQKETSESKPVAEKQQCFASNKQFVNCLR